MDSIMNWMKDFLIIYLIMTILTNLAATDQYKKHLQFFSGVVLLLVFVSPVLGLFGEQGKLEALISYEAFWEELDSARQDTKKLEFLQSSRYLSKYEEAIARDMKAKAQQREIPISQLQVRLSDDYEIQQVTVWLDRQQGVELTDKRKKLVRLLEDIYELREDQIYIDGK